MDGFNGYNFDKPSHRKKMKYLVVSDGDLDINNAYAYKSLTELRKSLLTEYKYCNKKLLAIFKIEDVTTQFNWKE